MYGYEPIGGMLQIYITKGILPRCTHAHTRDRPPWRIANSSRAIIIKVESRARIACGDIYGS